MIIDFHTHVFNLRSPQTREKQPVTWQKLLARLDDEGIDKAVVLPLGISPEIITGPSLFDYGNDIISQITPPHNIKDRVILFGNLDPRMGCKGNLTEEELSAHTPRTDFGWILREFTERGCVGIGEITSHLPQDDPLVINLFEQCGQYQLPVLFHTTGSGRSDVYGLSDETGLPRLENLLKAVPNTTCIAHATGIWAEIDGDVNPEDKFIYPRRRIKRPGKLLKLLESYDNLYVDTSGRSGYNALTRDIDFTVNFLNDYGDKIIFGTDVCFADPEDRMPHLTLLKNLLEDGSISRETFEKITYKNALKVLKRLTKPE